MMKRPGILISICALFFCAITTERADDIPKRLTFDRYSSMLNQSPFAVATAVAVPAATPNFAKDLYVANAARTADGDLVTIMSGGDKNLKEYLSTKQPNEHGYSISNIEWSDRPGATKVTISKDGQFATLAFNQALMKEGPGMPAQGVPNAIVQPSMPQPMPPPAIPRPNPQGIPTPIPHQRGLIPRTPNSYQPPSPPNVNSPEQ
jgi:hypothetical protein